MMKKDRLYKVDKRNKNLFWNGGGTDSTNQQAGDYTYSLNNVGNWMSNLNNNSSSSGYTGGNRLSGVSVYTGNTGKPTGPTNAQMQNTFGQINNYATGLNQGANNANGGSSAAQGISGGSGWEQAGGAISSALPSGEMTIGGNYYRRGVYDAADPLYYVAGGRESEVGNTLSDIGVSLTQHGGKWGALAGAGFKITGDLWNALGGEKTDKELLAATNDTINKNKNFRSNAQGFDDIVMPIAGNTSVLNSDVYEGSLFHSVGSKNDDLRNNLIAALDWSDRSVTNNVDNLHKDQLNRAYANYSAFGGPMDRMPFPQPYPMQNNMGALEYNIMSDMLTNKKQQTENKNTMSSTGNVFLNSPNGWYGLGGVVQTHGGDFSSGLTRINAGKSHEENPNDGVQMGVDSEGTPNLVEEGETVFNDYVYSNRIYADGGTLKRFHLPKKAKLTYAEISKKLEKESSERPNDPISQAGLKAQMHQLADEQERQKQEMDAQRAKAAFEALSPEEQVAVMENAVQQEAMAEQAAMQQPSPEEIAMAQQQQAMADGSQAALGQEAQPMMAEGGKINRFDWGGIADLFTNPDAAIIASKGKNRLPWNVKKGDYAKQRETEQDYKDWTQYVLDNWDSEQVQNYLKALDERAGGKHLSYAAEDAAAREAARKYWTDARQDGKWGYYHYTPTWEEKAKEVLEEKAPAVTPEARVFHAMDGDDYDGYIEGELDPNVVGDEVRRETLPNGDTVIYHGRAKTPEEKKAEEEKGVAPKHRAEWLRYAGLFGPAVGLGMMAAGIGRPDTAQLDAAVAGAGDVNTADWKPLGNYLTYRPLDIWFEQNRLNANARATDRAILNSGANQGSKMAGLLANGYNSQVASGNLFRQAQEYNDNLRKQVAEFNRGTDQFNSEQYGATSRFNADAYNNARRANAQLRLQAAAQKMDADAGWYNSLYGNIGALTKGIADIGTENKRDNMINWMISKGIFGAVDPNDPEMKKRVKVVSAEGGKLKKNKRRGLTF